MLPVVSWAMPTAVKDIFSGFVLHLDPAILIEGGATVSCAGHTPVKDVHYFVCVTHDASSASGTWVPTFTKMADGRIEILTAAKSGHPGWTKRATFYHPGQIWTVPDAAIPRAAEAGNDGSEGKNRAKRVTSLVQSIEAFRASAEVPKREEE